MILAYKLVWKTAFIKSLLKTAAIICIYNIVVFQAELRPGTFKLWNKRIAEKKAPLARWLGSEKRRKLWWLSENLVKNVSDYEFTPGGI